MANVTPFVAFICIVLNFRQFLAAETSDRWQTYIIHVEQQSGGLESWFDSYLPTSEAEPRVLYNYRNVFSGFAAKLTENDVEAMQKLAGFISARPERLFSLHTTHSPNFLGLNQNVGFWNSSAYGKGVIIGLLDTGVSPDHPSFSDEGLPLPPPKWKGRCEFNSSYVCNNKLIGARFFRNGNGTPLDEEGHGSHTSATAGGNFVHNAGIFDNARGTAVGIAPHAHLAMYKVCTSRGCAESDIIAAMDAAIEDGVDVLSLSLGGEPDYFYNDNIALGAYSAVQKGIFVSCSAGNSGPWNGTLSNEAPWILTVGASTIDRKIRAIAVLGNGEELEGQSAFQPDNFLSADLPLFFNSSAPFCSERELNNSAVNVMGKIVMCEVGGGVTRIGKGVAVKKAGGAAIILMNQEPQGYTTSAEAHVLPATHISYDDAVKLKAYANSSSTPTATIVYKGTVIGDDGAPVVAGFSSRGPSLASPGILKPDIIGPGVNILAAWPFSVENKEDSKSTFNMISGTSMSCPHLSGVAALLKSAHLDWSPAAIKSAIMTTADQVNLGGNPIVDQRFLAADVFAIGAGHVNPLRANDPGLVYDINPDEYIPYLCGLNYTDRQVGIIVQRKVECSKESSISEAELNYPSFSITFGSGTQSYTRTVTNVGEANSSYDVEIVAPAGVDVIVQPKTLSFSEQSQKLKYTVTFTRSPTAAESVLAQGYISWKSSKHSVRSPIAVVFGE